MTKKYYAVRNGRKVGIFETWEETKAQVIGYKNAIYKSFSTKIGGALIKKSLKNNLSKYNSDSIGGAPLLGVNQYVYKAHGSSNIKAFSSAILGLIDYINTDTIEKIKGELKCLEMN